MWWPYDSESPELPPVWVDFELWNNRTVLYLKSDQQPNMPCDPPLRVFYTKAHTLNGMDGATALRRTSSKTKSC